MSIYEQFVEFIERREGQLYAHCPFHRDDTPSFTVNEETDEWYCHSCNKGGAETEFVALIFDVSKNVARHAMNYFIAKGKWPFPTDEQINQYKQDLKNSSLDLRVLHEFGITDEVIEKYNLG